MSGVYTGLPSGCPRHEHAYLQLQLSATDASARTTMKGAAKCDKRCELQNSVNQQGFERILCFRDIPESIPASVSIVSISLRVFYSGIARRGSICASGWLSLLMHVEYQACGTANQPEKQISCTSVVLAVPLLAHHLFAWHSAQRHEVRSANPLNLSI